MLGSYHSHLLTRNPVLKVQGQPLWSFSVMPVDLSSEHSSGPSHGTGPFSEFSGFTWYIHFNLLLWAFWPLLSPISHSSSDISTSLVMTHSFLQALKNHPGNMLELFLGVLVWVLNPVSQDNVPILITSPSSDFRFNFALLRSSLRILRM